MSNKSDLFLVYKFLKILSNEGINESFEPKFLKFLTIIKKIVQEISDSHIIKYGAALLLADEFKKASVYSITEEKIKKRLNIQLKNIHKITIERLMEMKEDVPANNVGGVAGLDTNPPGVSPTLLRRKKFASKNVFLTDPNTYRKLKAKKGKHTRYESYIEEESFGNQILEYADKHPNEPIILMNELDGSMLYLSYGKSQRAFII